VFPNEPFDSYARYEPNEVDCWAKWESKSKTMEADLQARLRDRDNSKRTYRVLSILAQLGFAIIKFFTRDRS